MKSDLLKAEKLLIKIRKNLKRNDLDYTLQVSLNAMQPGRLRYAAQINPPADGLAPMSWVKDSMEELLEVLELSAKVLDVAAVDKAYHEAQITSCERTIEYHKEKIKEVENGTEEDK